MVGDHIVGSGLGEGGPAGARLEFLAAIEQQGAAADTAIVAGFETRTHLVAEGAFGTGLTGDLELLFGQLLAPLLGGFLDPLRGRWVALFRQAKNIVPGDHVVYSRANRLQADTGRCGHASTG